MLLHGFREREARTAVLLPARLRIGAAWDDATIHNVSSRGMLVSSDRSPQPGSYMELRRGSNVVIGRVVWRRGRFFGVHTQDRLDLAALQRQPQRRAQGGGPSNVPERRSSDRLRSDAATARQIERSQEWARMFQFAVVGTVSAVACASIAVSIYHALESPFARIETALGQQP